MSLTDLRSCFIHLRLGFQLCLSPIFLFGFVLAGDRVGRDVILGYIAFHLFLYAGGTALNSYYDRDTGPVGGLAHPPPIPRGLLGFSILWQIIGWALALAVNPSLAAIYLSMFWLSLGYSHPRTRLKGKPLAALGTIALGQGVLPFFAGWVCARGDLSAALSLPQPLGLFAATSITVGLYPLTEIYQIDEDLRRGDLTLAAWLGPSRSFQFAIGSLVLGGLAAIALVIMQYTLAEAMLISLFLAGTLFAVRQWSRTFRPSAVMQNFRTAMRLYVVTSLGFAGWLVLHLAGIL